MTDSRTTELLRELRDLACDIHAAEIIDHVHITNRGWTFDSRWLDSWHAEFDRITNELDSRAGCVGESQTINKTGDFVTHDSGVERTCRQEERGWGTEGDHARVWLTCGHDCMVPTVQDLPNYCPECGAKVVEK